MNFAAIDIGSNAVRLLIKSVNEKSKNTALQKELFLRMPMRLGFDVFSMGRISDSKMEKMVRLMKAYKQFIKIYDVDIYRACATSAMRDAINGQQLIDIVYRKTGIRIEIIPGEEEAHIIYNNHLEQTGQQSGNFLYVDVGGGSTEINLLSEGKLICARSYNIGTIRSLNCAVAQEDWRKMGYELSEITKKCLPLKIIGSGGNINRLYRMAEKKDKVNKIIEVEELASIYAVLSPLTKEQRMERFALKTDRADVIVPAAEIFLNIATAVGAKEIQVPIIGLSDGIIDALYRSVY